MLRPIDDETRAFDKAIELLDGDQITQFAHIVTFLGTESRPFSLNEIGVELGLYNAWILYRDQLARSLESDTLREVISQPKDQPLNYELTMFGRAVLQKLAALTETKEEAARD